MRNVGFNAIALIAVVVSGALLTTHNLQTDRSREILNTSYDPTRELYVDLNRQFVGLYAEQFGTKLNIRQSHGGSSRQVRELLNGLDADVVTLALPSDVEALHAHGLIADGWAERLPDRSTPYISTIVFVVRRGNPRGIHDWPDLIRPGVGVVTPNPKTSGNGKLTVLSAWGSVVCRGGKDAQAAKFLNELFHHVVVLGDGAREATNSFAADEIGDVHLTWENEALLEIGNSGGKLEIVYPPISIRAEPAVAWIDVNVRRHGTEAAAKA